MKSWNFEGSRTKKTGVLLADHVVVALLGVELQREAARVADRVREALLAGHRGEAREHRRPLADLGEEVRLGVLGHVLGDLEEAVRTAALGVHHALGHALTVEVLHLLHEVVVVQGDGAAGPDGQRVLVAGGGDAAVGGGGLALLLVAHALPLWPEGSCGIRNSKFRAGGSGAALGPTSPGQLPEERDAPFLGLARQAVCSCKRRAELRARIPVRLDPRSGAGPQHRGALRAGLRKRVADHHDVDVAPDVEVPARH